MFGSVLQDLRFGWRSLRRAPVVSAIAILTIALSIGGNAAIFSLVNAVLLKPLEFSDPGRLVRLFGYDRQEGDGYKSLSFPNFQDLRKRSRSFSEVAAFRNNGHVSILVLAVALQATWAPAWRATRLSPGLALRSD